MRRIRFQCLLLIAPLALGANACADGDPKHHSSSGGSGGAVATGGKASAGAKTTGGANDTGGTSSEAGEPGGETAGVGGATDGGEGGASEPGGAAGAGGVDGRSLCKAPTSLSILGDYTEPTGDELWLRDSGKAVTWTRVASGKPASAKPPGLWQVVQACSEGPALVLENSAGAFVRLDYFEGAKSLTACLSAASASSVDGARELVAADRGNTIDSGCNGGPWTRFTKGLK